MPYKHKARKKDWAYRKKLLFWIRDRDKVITTAIDETLTNADKMSRDELCDHIKAKLGRIPGEEFTRKKK